jgi:hypothetical protein
MVDPTEERRRPPQRKRVLKKGRIVFNDRHSTIDCTVRDLSPWGARLLVQTLAAVPDRFDLIIDSDGTEHEARVVWKRASEMGVKFR